MQLLTADKQLVHYNRLANHFSDTLVAAPVGGTCGGFLCDEMVSSNVEELQALRLKSDLQTLQEITGHMISQTEAVNSSDAHTG